MSARFVRVIPIDPGDPGLRIRIERETNRGYIDLVEERVWPEQVLNPDSNHICETLDAMVLNTAHARWLYAALGELLAEASHEDQND